MGPSVADMSPLPGRWARERNDARAVLDSIRLDDGMSRDEASIIANVYFLTYVGRCGGAFYPREQAGSWTFRIAIGSAGADAGEMEIQASTGRMTWDDGLVFGSFAEFRRDVVDHFGRRVWHGWLRDVCPLYRLGDELRIAIVQF
jgi:hypothetical protein